MKKFSHGGPSYSSEEVSIPVKETRFQVDAIIEAIDAAWVDWTPTYTYTGTGPVTGNLLSNVARYRRLGKTVHFGMYLNAATGTSTNATALTISLPIAPKDINAYIPVKATQLVNATYSDPMGYIDALTNTEAQRLIRFHSFTQLQMHSAPYAMEIMGCLEVA